MYYVEYELEGAGLGRKFFETKEGAKSMYDILWRSTWDDKVDSKISNGDCIKTAKLVHIGKAKNIKQCLELIEEDSDELEILENTEIEVSNLEALEELLN